MGILLSHAIWWTGAFTIVNKVVVPFVQGVVDGVKDGRKEFKKEKEHK